MGHIIASRSELEAVSRDLHAQSKRIVTTNGVFDIMHVGHVRFLRYGKSLGDVLIVGVNADSSVKQYKGDKRPILPEADRAELVAALSCVDFVHIFSERTPEAWLEVVKPSVHVKAGDYTLDREKETPKTKVWEREVVEKHGGQCVIAPLVQGKSTTAVIEKITEVYGLQSSSRMSGHGSSAVFLDRDGTIIQDKGYMRRVEDLEFIPGAIEALRKLSENHFKLFVVSNQAGIARGIMSEIECERFSQHFIEELSKNQVRLDGVYQCPHHPAGARLEFSRDCACRKPKPGMVISALKAHHVDLSASFVVGDKTADIMMGNNLGIRSVLVSTGKAGMDREHPARPDAVVADLACAAEWILGQQQS